MNKLVTGILFLLFFNAKNHAQQEPANGFFPAVNTCVLTDVQKQKTTLLTLGAKPLLLFIFLSPECPLCQNYTRVFNDIQQQYKEKLEVFGIVPGDAYSIKNITDFKKKYNTAFNCYSDKKMALTKYLQATITPQVILLNANMQLLYTGAVDDWAISLGKKRVQTTQHYLIDAIEQSLHNTPVLIASTKAVGCKINDY